MSQEWRNLVLILWLVSFEIRFWFFKRGPEGKRGEPGPYGPPGPNGDCDRLSREIRLIFKLCTSISSKEHVMSTGQVSKITIETHNGEPYARFENGWCTWNGTSAPSAAAERALAVLDTRERVLSLLRSVKS